MAGTGTSNHRYRNVDAMFAIAVHGHYVSVGPPFCAGQKLTF